MDNDMLDKCPFCGGGNIEPLNPENVLGVYCMCLQCGAIGGLNKRNDGSYYTFWRSPEMLNYNFDQNRLN